MLQFISAKYPEILPNTLVQFLHANATFLRIIPTSFVEALVNPFICIAPILVVHTREDLDKSIWIAIEAKFGTKTNLKESKKH